MDETLPQPGGDGLVLIDALCVATGLSGEELDELVMAGRMVGGYTDAHELVGIFESSLPTKQELTEWGCSVADSYSPDSLRSKKVPGILPGDRGDGSEPSSNVVRW